MRKPELLAPAGNMQCLYAAINAGADAVYLAGKEFGARASADNFTTEELIYAIELAHLHDVKIYLTLNTLIKEREWNKLYDFLKPLAEVNLDGIIIQDYGLIDFMKSNFPNIELHASTQMTITGPFAASLLKEKGVTRIVPARELSLNEIENIKNNVDIEIEAFIHGAMCYCYSGQCLFSSFLGGRSGNRGRCAGPCRLPYTVMDGTKYIKKDQIIYPLSLKDMCTITCIDKLIDAGIDSFKIEGRLKSPEYVAGVTAIYRKYIDIYCEKHILNIDPADIDNLSKLYMRTELSDGYYFKHNSKDMITMQSPSYGDISESLCEEINSKYVKTVNRIPLTGIITLVPGERTSIILHLDEYVISCEGDLVDTALNKPLSEEDVRKQMNKTGESFFTFSELEIIMEDNCFLPVKALNELRRQAFDLLKKEMLYD